MFIHKSFWSFTKKVRNNLKIICKKLESIKNFTIFELLTKTKTMKNTKIQIQEEILKVQSEIREIQKNLKNSKDYLKYLRECFEDEQKQEEEEEEVFIGGCASCGIDTEETDINGNCKNCK